MTRRATRRGCGGARGDRGIALVVVLWVSMLLAGFAGAFVLATRDELTVSRNLLDRAEASALADGGVDLAVFDLLRPPADRQWRADGTAYSLPAAAGTVELAIEDEAGKIDLNRAPDALIHGLLVEVGATPEEADSLTDAILDWRDPDDLTRLHGAEAGAYRGLGYGPRNGPFATVAELRSVLGMTDDLYRRVAPYVTVDAREPGVDLATAGPEVLGAIPGVTADDVSDFIAARGTDGAAVAIPAFLNIGEVGHYRSRRNGRAFTVRVRVVTGNGARFVREAVVELARVGGRPYVVREWREGTDSATAAAGAAADAAGKGGAS